MPVCTFIFLSLVGARPISWARAFAGEGQVSAKHWREVHALQDGIQKTHVADVPQPDWRGIDLTATDGCSGHPPMSHPVTQVTPTLSLSPSHTHHPRAPPHTTRLKMCCCFELQECVGKQFKRVHVCPSRLNMLEQAGKHRASIGQA